MKKLFANEEILFPKSFFLIILFIFFLTAGFQMALIVAMMYLGWSAIIQTHIMIFYWLGATLVLDLLLNARIKTVYEAPMRSISEATKKVASGDFSAHIETLHEPGQEDFLDCIINDFNNMFAELASIETLKTDFISNMSHEIKTPIAVIQNYSRLLQSEELSEEQRIEYSKVIYDAAFRLNTLVSNTLKLNRLENQRIGLKKEQFDLSGQLTECLLGFETVWEEKHIHIIPEIEDEIVIESDQELLTLVWNNLLSNAFKFTEPGGMVRLTLERIDTTTIVSVSDTGCGISPEACKRIFDKFYQGDTVYVTQGNGLGLALVKQILDMLDGTITVESVPGEGSTFTVYL